ncbi:MAG: YkgJ family cysteine cluster protein [Thermodesulfovibrionales bacterium]|nr:YkgJ family cysteine cluster protein [Thermodesulfovibrionales bacterium]
MSDLKDKLQIITPFTPSEEIPTERQKKVIVRQTECNKCGTCCIGASPMLIKEDYKLYVTKIINERNTYTVRVNEPIYNRREQELFFSPIEGIKIDEDSGCIFYEGAGECSIYNDRPLQCREFRCWDNTPQLEGLENRCLTRKDIFSEIPLLLDIIDKHEDICSYERFLNLIEEFQNDKEVLEEIGEILQYDKSAREYVSNSFGVDEKTLNLIFGKPMTECLEYLGIHISKDEEGFVLSKINREDGRKLD